MKTFIATLQETHAISPHVKHFVFEADRSASQESDYFAYIPGQFITIHFEKDNKSLKRSYSIANAPNHNFRIEFAASFVPDGVGTALLFALQPGNQLTLSGPYGRLILRDHTPKRYIFIATSTGITPYRAMLKELQQRLLDHPELTIVIIAGGQHPADILYRDEWIAFAQENTRVTFRAQISRSKEADLGLFDHMGRVQAAFPELNLKPSEDEIYLCGNPNMIDESFEYLKTQGFSVQNVVREKYISR